jgi:hypothetical protein
MQFYGKAKELCQEKLGLTTAPVTLAPPPDAAPAGTASTTSSILPVADLEPPSPPPLSSASGSPPFPSNELIGDSFSIRVAVVLGHEAATRVEAQAAAPPCMLGRCGPR